MRDIVILLSVWPDGPSIIQPPAAAKPSAAKHRPPPPLFLEAAASASAKVLLPNRAREPLYFFSG
ncbi:MAG TPA: hypothetical protein VF654_16760, partial [Pyrinomonadaceae bacterium]